MDLYDKICICITLIGIVMTVTALVVHFRRGDFHKRNNDDVSFAFVWTAPGMGIVVPLFLVGMHHVQFLLASMLFFGWLAVCVFTMWRANREEEDKEIAEGRIPKIYNDWAKPDPL